MSKTTNLGQVFVKFLQITPLVSYAASTCYPREQDTRELIYGEQEELQLWMDELPLHFMQIQATQGFQEIVNIRACKVAHGSRQAKPQLPSVKIILVATIIRMGLFLSMVFVRVRGCITRHVDPERHDHIRRLIGPTIRCKSWHNNCHWS